MLPPQQKRKQRRGNWIQERCILNFASPHASRRPSPVVELMAPLRFCLARPRPEGLTGSPEGSFEARGGGLGPLPCWPLAGQRHRRVLLRRRLLRFLRPGCLAEAPNKYKGPPLREAQIEASMCRALFRATFGLSRFLNIAEAPEAGRTHARLKAPKGRGNGARSFQRWMGFYRS